MSGRVLGNADCKRNEKCNDRGHSPHVTGGRIHGGSMELGHWHVAASRGTPDPQFSGWHPSTPSGFLAAVANTCHVNSGEGFSDLQRARERAEQGPVVPKFALSEDPVVSGTRALSRLAWRLQRRGSPERAP